MKIQELLGKEVVSYRKVQPIDFNALISSKMADARQVEDDPYADLNAFLAQVALPDTKSKGDNAAGNALLTGKPTQPSTNPLLAANQPAPTGLKTSNSLLESQSANPLLAKSTKANNSLLDSQPNKTTNPLLAQAVNVPFQKSNNNPLLFGSAERNSLLESSENPLIKADIKKEKGGEEEREIISITVPTTSESDQSNDTELFNTFLKGHVKAESDAPDSLTVSTVAKAASDDIEMISAKLRQTDISGEKAEMKGEVKVERPEEESRATDTKSILRQRLIDKQNASKLEDMLLIRETLIS